MKNSHLLRFVFLVINILFISKYIIRLNYSPILFSVIYILIMLICFYLLDKLKDNKSKKKGKVFYVVFMLLIVLAISFFHIIQDPYLLQTDRWSAIHFFLQNLFNGEYPYLAETHLGGYGSPFPVWHSFHIPFFLLGNIALGMTFSFVLLSVVIVWFLESYMKALKYIILLTLSPAFWYEVVTMSDLLYNFILCMLIILVLHKKQITIKKKALGVAIICGLFMSTRLSVFIPLFLYLFPDFLKVDNKNKILFGLVSIAVFCITFLPFLFWDYNSLLFFQYNPFVLQTRQGSIFDIVILVVLLLIFSLKWKNNLYLCFSYIATVIFVIVSIAFLFDMLKNDFIYGLFSSRHDITYFNMALPFIVFVIANNER